MEDILKSLGYSPEVINNFNREGVTTEAVLSLNMFELQQLGIEGIGRQAILRGRCRRHSESFNRAASSGRQVHQVAGQQQTRQLFAPYSRNQFGRKRTNTTTMTFLCLSARLCSRVPSVYTQKVLRQCGLGEKKLTLPSSASPEEVMDCVYANFPKLKDGGGFEYLKADGSTKSFMEIPLPEGGFSALNLKAMAKGSRIYLRPVQSDLDMTKVVPDNSDHQYETWHKCQKCNELVAQTKLRRHVRVCQREQHQGGSDSEENEDDIMLLSDPFQETNIVTRGASTVANSPASNSLAATQPLSTLPVTHEAGLDSNSATMTMTGNPTSATSMATTPPNTLPVTSIAGPSRQWQSHSGQHRVRHDPSNIPSCSNMPNIACYNEYAVLLDEIDEDPDADVEEIDAGIIEESLLDFDDANVADEALMQQRITEFQGAKESKEEHATIVVRRSKLVHTTVLAAASKQPSFYMKELVVNFSGEGAADLGGPKREFFRLLMDNLPFLKVFEGHPPKLYFSHDLELLQLQRYRLAGRFVSWCVLHNGPGFPFFHPAIFDMMCSGSTQEKLCIDDLGDYEVAERLKKIQQCTSQENLDDVLKDIGDWAADMGCNSIYSLQVSEKETAIDRLLKQHIYYRSKTELDQFTQGLEDVGSFWTIVKNDWKAFRGLFTNGKKTLTLSSFRLLIKYFKADDPRLKEGDEETIFSWEQLLARCDAGACTIGLPQILMFATGADTIPPLGFHKQIEVHFYSPVERSKNYPIAHACPMELHLPRNASDVDTFCENFVEAVLWSPGFGKT